MPDSTIPGAVDPALLSALEGLVGSTEELTDAQKKQAAQQAKVNDVLKNYLGTSDKAAKNTKAFGVETKRSATDLAALRATVFAAGTAINRFLLGVQNTARAQLQYRLEQERVSRVLGLYGDELNNLTKSLNLTREQARSFFSTMEQAKVFGVGAQQVRKMTRELELLRGQEQALKVMQQLPELAKLFGAEGILKLQTGGLEDFVDDIRGLPDELIDAAFELRAATDITGTTGDVQRRSDVAAGVEELGSSMDQLAGDIASNIFDHPSAAQWSMRLGKMSQHLGGAFFIGGVLKDLAGKTLGVMGATAKASWTTARNTTKMAATPGGGGRGGILGGGRGRMIGGIGLGLAGLGVMAASKMMAPEEEDLQSKNIQTRQKALEQQKQAKSMGIAGSILTGVGVGMAVGGPLGALAGGAIAVASQWDAIKTEWIGIDGAQDEAAQTLSQIGGGAKNVSDWWGRVKTAWAERSKQAGGFFGGMEQQRIDAQQQRRETFNRNKHEQDMLQEAENTFQLLKNQVKMTGKLANLMEQRRKQIDEFGGMEQIAGQRAAAGAELTARGGGDLGQLMQKQLQGVTAAQEDFQNKVVEAQMNRIKEARAAIEKEMKGGKLKSDHFRKAINSAIEIAVKKGIPRETAARMFKDMPEMALRELKMQEEIIKTQQEKAALVYLQQIEAIWEKTLNAIETSPAVLKVESALKEQVARTALAATGGLSPGEAQQLYAAQARVARAAANVRTEETERRIAEIRKEMLPLINKETDARKKAALQTKMDVAIADKRIQAIQSQQQAMQAELAVAEEISRRRMGLLGVQQSRLDAERQVAETMGSSFQTIFQIQQDQVALKRQELSIVREEMGRVKNALESAGKSAKDSEEFQKLQTKEVQIQAQIIKSVTGLQRDFLDRALARGFGTPTGTKFQPIAHQRFVMGEFTDVAGLARRGMVAGEDQRQRLGLPGMDIGARGVRGEAGLNRGGRGFGFRGDGGGGPPQKRTFDAGVGPMKGFQPNARVPGLGEGASTTIQVDLTDRAAKMLAINPVPTDKGFS